ncbi:MAG: tail fiber domain-containing protein [Chitinophagaceae bacterium]|nr:tail fiber domain-containing protein [Chitinophagaceae bacterium]
MAGNYGDAIEDFVPANGGGIKLMWLPARYAFRAGSVSGTQWDKSNIGFGSFAVGQNNKSSGEGSGTIGKDNVANNYYSVAMGYNDTASGGYSIALGYRSVAKEQASISAGYEAKSEALASVAMGFRTTATGTASTAFGNGTKAIGTASTAFGIATQASGDYSFSTGSSSTAHGSYSFAAGLGTKAFAYSSTVLGQYNVPDLFVNPTVPACTDWIFVIGNGTINKPQNALWLTRGADLYIGGTFSPNKGVVCVSDIRLKENIQPIMNVLGKIDQIQPISYYFKDTSAYSASHQIGFSAQEIEKTFPELVTKNDKGYLAVNYAQITAVAIQAIKEQQKIIKHQDNKIASLESRLQKLEEIIIKIK